MVLDRWRAGSFASVADVREAARRRTPRMVFDYVDGGARGEVTMHANRVAFDEIARCIDEDLLPTRRYNPELKLI